MLAAVLMGEESLLVQFVVEQCLHLLLCLNETVILWQVHAFVILLVHHESLYANFGALYIIVGKVC